MSAEESTKFQQLLEHDASVRSESAKSIDKKIRDADEYAIVKLY
jgi:hypothetical protein